MPWQKNFDVDEALAKAGEAFWTHGYEATSLCDLLDAMGIRKGSFYDTYGSKKDAYLKALQRYVDERFAAFRAMIDGESPRQSIESMLRSIYRECVSPDGHRGCMVINCALELAHDDEDARGLVRRTFRAHEALFAKQIRAAKDAGELGADLDAAATAKVLMAMVMGMRVYARSGAGRATLHTLLDQALHLLEPAVHTENKGRES